jgi:O-acetyl-ADP-ribose deacetylase
MNFTLKTIQCDITQIPADAIVNAANKTLSAGGGVDGAIHHVAGPKLMEECLTLGGCETGEAKFTKAYNLLAKYVIHTVGPIYGQENGKEDELLANCYRNSLKLANELKVETITFPCISTGVFRFSSDLSARIAIKTVREYLHNNKTTIIEVIFVTYRDEETQLYQELLG